MAAHFQSPRAVFPDPIPFSLFEGDLVSRIFARLGMGTYQAGDLMKRSVMLIGITWVPLALLAIFSEVHWVQPPGQNFFLDFAAYGQLLVGLPMFLLAERVIDGHTRNAVRSFLTTGVVRPEDAPRLLQLSRQVRRLRKQLWPEMICIGIGYLLTVSWVLPEMYNDRDTWHAMGPIVQTQPFSWSGLQGLLHQSPQSLTWPGLLELGFVGPLTTYWWLRWSWKIGIWSWYLYGLSRLQLNLVASHPDKTGGIGFLSDVQTKFGLVILAYGISYVAPTIGYKLAFEGATMSVVSVWGYAVSFVIGAPLLFTIPLFMFTKQLYHAKTCAMKIFQERSMERALAFEEKWLKACSSGNYELMSSNDVTGLKALNLVYDHIHAMRVVPFDLRSFSELVGAALGPMIPLLPYLVGLPEPWLRAIEAGKKLLR
jgi:hypothetical protein